MPRAQDDGRNRGLLVFLHGHGSAASELTDLKARLGLGSRWTVVVPAGAGRELDDRGSWFENEPRGVDSGSLDASTEHLETAIGVLLDRGGFEPGELVVGGFSQGAAMALVLASRGVVRGGRLLICSGWIPEGPGVDPDLTDSGVSTALVQLARDDDVVPTELTRWSAEALGSTGCAVDLLEYPGGHGLSPEMGGDAGRWLSGA